MGCFDSISSTFLSQIEDLETCHSHLACIRDLRAHIYPNLRWEAVQQGDKLMLDRYLKRVLPERAFINSLFMSLASSFEDFLRSILVTTIKEVNAKTLKFGDLTLKFRNKHLQSSGNLLASHATAPAYMKLNTRQISENIASCYEDSVAFKLNTEMVHFTKAIIGLESLFEFLDMLDISLSFQELAKDELIKSHYPGTKINEREKLLEDSHSELLRLRNAIAHSGLANSDLSTQIFGSHMALLKVECDSICNIVERGLNK